MSRWASLGIGQYRAGETHTFLADRLYAGDGTRRAILVCPGRGTAAGSTSTVFTGWVEPVTFALADAGFALLYADMGGGFTHGNAAAGTATGQAKSYAASAYGAKSDKVGILGTSMGSLTALRYYMDNPTLVSCACFGVPDLNLQDVHDVTRTDLASEIETAHGGPSGYNSYLSAYNPSSHTSSFTSLPMQIHYASNDPNFTAGVATSFCSATGAEAINMGAVGHNAQYMDPARAVAFFRKYLG